ncbi:MAG: Hpt domain-containing protein [Gammaproteobacteria bacterium]|nr:Hpt domain-containing protein [Gammaproteobacteria bacterium]
MTKILDIPESITAANGNASLAKDLFAMLLDDLNARLEYIKNSFQSNDMEALGEHIHKLYGATAYCIVPLLRNRTETLDQALREKDYSQLNELVESVIQEIKQLIKDGPTHIEKDWLSINKTE